MMRGQRRPPRRKDPALAWADDPEGESSPSGRRSKSPGTRREPRADASSSSDAVVAINSSAAGSSSDPMPSSEPAARPGILQQRSFDSAAQERSFARAQAAGTAFSYAMRSDASDEERVEGARKLAQFVNAAYGHDAMALGEHLRSSFQLAMVMALLYEGSSQMHRYGLMILANLVSDTFDPKSAETKTKIYHAGVFERIKDFLFAGDEVAQTCACGVLQNLCIDVRFARLLRSYELLEELERLVQSDNRQLRRFAAGALHNTMESLQAAFLASSIENRDKGGAHGLRVLERLMAPGDTDPEFEVSDDALGVVSEIAAENAAAVEHADEAIRLLQGAIRRRRGRRSFEKLLQLCRCVRLVGRYVRRWRWRRRRRAILTLQLYARARMCAVRGICSIGAMRLVILGLRAAEARCITRIVNANLRAIALRELADGTSGRRTSQLASLVVGTGSRQQGLAVPDSPTRSPGMRALALGSHNMRRRIGRLLLAGRSSLALAGRSTAPPSPHERSASNPMPRPPTVSARLPVFSGVTPGQSPRIQPIVTGSGARGSPDRFAADRFAADLEAGLAGVGGKRGSWGQTPPRVMPGARVQSRMTAARDLERQAPAAKQALLASLVETTEPASPASPASSASAAGWGAKSREVSPEVRQIGLVDEEANLVGGEIS